MWDGGSSNYVYISGKLKNILFCQRSNFHEFDHDIYFHRYYELVFQIKREYVTAYYELIQSEVKMVGK